MPEHLNFANGQVAQQGVHGAVKQQPFLAQTDAARCRSGHLQCCPTCGAARFCTECGAPVGNYCAQGTLPTPAANRGHEQQQQQQQQLRGGAAASTPPQHPLAHTAFNMGFNVIDIDTWKELQLTEHYELWVAASNDRKLFPPDTLAFGLVIAYLALGEAVQCYDDQVTHLVGLAFIPKERLEGEYGWTTQRMRDEAFALHFNGSNKPWDEIGRAHV